MHRTLVAICLLTTAAGGDRGTERQGINQEKLANEQQRKIVQTGLQRALWQGLKKQLTAPDGEQYFESNLKGTAVPPLRGKLISARPPEGSKELVIGIIDAKIPEVTLRLDSPFSFKLQPGDEIEFEGVAIEFTKDPFNLSFDVLRAKVSPTQ